MNLMLKEKVLNKRPGIITYGITPPKQNSTSDKIAEIAAKQVERIRDLDIDGLVIYDIQDEADRVQEKRPFPFLPTVEPTLYANKYLKALQVPKIIYRCVGKYSRDELMRWTTTTSKEDRFSVFVGASSPKKRVGLELSEAYRIKTQYNPALFLGGVLIPERHVKTHDEHLRIIHKMEQGCNFFISQAIYNVEAAKDFLSDYYYYCQSNQIEMVPVLMNLTPCGSMKTLEFMKWLGINVPKWLENELMHSQDILDKSINLSKQLFEELLDFSLEKGIPLGCSIESVSTRKTEIEASIQLTKDIQTILNKKLV